MTVNVAYVQSGGYTAAQQRRDRAAVLTKGSAAATARTGIIPFNGAELLPVAAGTPNMTTITSAGGLVLADAAGGAYIFTSDAATTLTHAAANGTNPRIDLVIARVYDNEVGDAAPTTSLTLPGSAGTTLVQQYTGQIEIVQGTPAATPLVPALPNTRCAILRQATIRAAATSILNSDLTNTGRPGWTVASGGVLPALTTAELAALNQYKGMYADAGDTNLLMRSDGSSFSVIADPAAFTPWTAYTPAWNGTIGNGTIAGSYKLVGKTLHWRVRMVLGSTSSGPGVVYTWTLPVAVAMPFGTHTRLGHAKFWGGATVDGTATPVDATHCQAWFTGQSAAAQSPANPGTWGTGVEIVLGGTCEAA